MALQGFLNDVQVSSPGNPEDESFDVSGVANLANTAIKSFSDDQVAQSQQRDKTFAGQFVSDRSEEEVRISLAGAGLEEGQIDDFLKNQHSQAAVVNQLHRQGGVTGRTAAALQRNLGFRRALAERPDQAENLANIWSQAFGGHVAGIVDIQKQEQQAAEEEKVMMVKQARQSMIDQGAGQLSTTLTDKQALKWHFNSRGYRDYVNTKATEAEIEEQKLQGTLDDTVNIPLQKEWSSQAISKGIDMFSSLARDLSTTGDFKQNQQTFQKNWSQFQLEYMNNTPSLTPAQRSENLGVLQKYVTNVGKVIDGTMDLSEIEYESAFLKLLYSEHQKEVLDAETLALGGVDQQAAQKASDAAQRRFNTSLQAMESIKNLSVKSAADPYLNILGEIQGNGKKRGQNLAAQALSFVENYDNVFNKANGIMPPDATTDEIGQAVFNSLVTGQQIPAMSVDSLKKISLNGDVVLANMSDAQQSKAAKLFIVKANDPDIKDLIATNPGLYLPIAKTARHEVQGQVVTGIRNMNEDIATRRIDEGIRGIAPDFNMAREVEVDPAFLKKGVIMYRLKASEGLVERPAVQSAEISHYLDQYNLEHSADLSNAFQGYASLSANDDYNAVWADLAGTRGRVAMSDLTPRKPELDIVLSSEEERTIRNLRKQKQENTLIPTDGLIPDEL